MVSPLQGKLLGVLFFEASTRTSCSFQAAMLRLGGGVVPLHNDTSSASKGESLEGQDKCLGRPEIQDVSLSQTQSA